MSRLSPIMNGELRRASAPRRHVPRDSAPKLSTAAEKSSAWPHHADRQVHRAQHIAGFDRGRHHDAGHVGDQQHRAFEVSCWSGAPIGICAIRARNRSSRIGVPAPTSSRTCPMLPSSTLSSSARAEILWRDDHLGKQVAAFAVYLRDARGDRLQSRKIDLGPDLVTHRRQQLLGGYRVVALQREALEQDLLSRPGTRGGCRLRRRRQRTRAARRYGTRVARRRFLEDAARIRQLQCLAPRERTTAGCRCNNQS